MPSKKAYSSYWVREITLAKDQYAVMPAQLTVTGEGVTWYSASAEALAWLAEQISHATKIEARSSAPTQ